MTTGGPTVVVLALPNPELPRRQRDSTRCATLGVAWFGMENARAALCPSTIIHTTTNPRGRTAIPSEFPLPPQAGLNTIEVSYSFMFAPDATDTASERHPLNSRQNAQHTPIITCQPAKKQFAAAAATHAPGLVHVCVKVIPSPPERLLTLYTPGSNGLFFGFGLTSAPTLPHK